jgi:hypothetical protein
VAALLGLLASPGCSFIFVQGPPPPSANAVQVDCVGGMWAPVVDTVLTTPPTLLLLSRATDADYDDAWRVVKKAETTRMIGRAAGEGLVVEKAESAGGLIGIVAGRPQGAQWSD